MVNTMPWQTNNTFIINFDSQFISVFPYFTSISGIRAFYCFSAYFDMSFPSKGLNYGLKWSMNQNLDLCSKPSIYAASQRSKILLSRPNCLNFPDPENSAIFRQMPSDICRSPMHAKLFKSFIHQAFQLLWRSFITGCFPSRPAFPFLPLHPPVPDACRYSSLR